MDRLIVFFLIVVLAQACQPNTKSTALPIASGPDSAPSSWMYSQRAFPNGINRKVKKAALKQYKAMSLTQDRRFDKPWSAVGPSNIGGRITDIALHPTDLNVIYAGSSVGGVWKSEDKGYNWSQIFAEPGGISIGDLAVSPVDPEIIYIGTGEANGSATSGAFFGDGIYKSEDGGDTWQNVGLPFSDHVGRVLCHPNDSDIAYVAATGKLYGKNQERGVYKTINGGQSWEQKFFINDSTALIDLAMSAAAPEVLFAASWERTRFPEGRVYGGFSSGIHRSLDGGETWEELVNGLPENPGDIGRIGLAVSQTNPDVVYASYTENVITNRFLGIYKSIDQGDSWVELNGDTLQNVYASFGWFFGNLRIHPADDDEIYVMGLRTQKTQDGNLWYRWTNNDVHVDQHGMEIHPLDSDFTVIGNDGGIYITEDGGLNFRHVETIDNTQFYECAIHPTIPQTYLGGTQDNGTLLTLSNGIDGYRRITGGDGFGVQFDKINPEIVYTTSQFGFINRLTSIDPVMARSIRPDPELAARNNWNTPFVTIPDVLGGIIYGAERVLMSTDTGNTWIPISPDLSNGPYEGSDFGTITCLAMSNLNTDIILAGTNDGNVQITTDAGENWDLISDDLPYLEVSSVATDPFDEATIYVTYSGYRFDNYLPHVLKSSDYGGTWTDISANLPETPINEIVPDPLLEDHYYLATDLGVFFSGNGGVSWEILGTELPATIVNDLDLHPDNRELLAGTFGRSMWTYDLPTEPITSTADIASDMLTLFPNPVRDRLSVTLANISPVESAAVHDNAGRVIQTWQGLPDIVDVSDLPAGMYHFRITTADRILTKKFVKQ